MGCRLLHDVDGDKLTIYKLISVKKSRKTKYTHHEQHNNIHNRGENEFVYNREIIWCKISSRFACACVSNVGLFGSASEERKDPSLTVENNLSDCCCCLILSPHTCCHETVKTWK